MHDKLVEEISELNARRDSIKAKLATAKMQTRINELGSSVGTAKTNLGAFARMEDKANRLLDEANAMAELNAAPVDEIDDLMSKYDTIANSSIEDELAALKSETSSVIDDELAVLKSELK